MRAGSRRLQEFLSGPTATRWGLVAAMGFAYWLVFPFVHSAIGSPTFLLGQAICLVSALLLGVRGAVAAILMTVALDRLSAMAMSGPEFSPTAGVISALCKIVVSGGLGQVVDSRRRLRDTNERLNVEITARREAEASLRQSDALHRALFESLGEGVGVFDSADRCLMANAALAPTLHTNREDLEDKPFQQLLKLPTGHGVPAPADADLEPRSYDATPNDDDATLLVITETTLPRPDTREPLTLRIVRDLTDRIVTERRHRDLERELQRAQALQSLAVLAGGVAHDFNNLLNGVLGNVELAKLKMGPASSTVGKCLDQIKEFADEASHLSRQMLTYAGRRSLAIGRVDVNKEVADVLRLLQATVASQARLALELEDDLPEVAADRFQVRQVLVNLLLNAAEAMAGQRGTLTLRSANVDLSADARRMGLAPGSYVKISVSDTGPGIAAEDRERIFEPFFSTKSTGRGMGLAAAAGIVRTHQGWLGVEDSGRPGTTISVILPLAQASTPVHSPTNAESVPPLSPRTVLLIDDAPAVRLVSAQLLRELGQEVLTAANGPRGIELFRARADTIDIVVLDLTMPGLSGAEVLSELIELQPDVRVVISSGFHPADAEDILRSPNVVGFLEKPHSLAKLEGLLTSVAPPRSHGASAPKLKVSVASSTI